MRKVIALLWIFLLFPAITWAQDKIVAPVWNVGDKWVFTQGSIEVVGIDKSSCILSFSKDTCIIESKGFDKIVYGKPTFNKTYGVKGDEREKYTIAMRRMLNFPWNLGKQWNDNFSAEVLVGPRKGETQNFSEAFKVIGWEDVQVQAGSFKTIKLEYNQVTPAAYIMGTATYWYAPEVKYFVKCQYRKDYYQGVADWELVSFKLKK